MLTTRGVNAKEICIELLKLKGCLAMNSTYTAVITRDGDWWLGWIEEVSGINCQERSRAKLLDSLKVTLREALDFNRSEAIEAAGADYEEEKIAV